MTNEANRDLVETESPSEVIEVANDNHEEPEIPVFTREQMEIANWGNFCTLQVGQDPITGEIQMGIIQIPVPIDMVNAFQEQMGAEMAKENMKFVVYKGNVFLAPVRTTSLVGFD